jgi:hypothetical protein
MKTGEAISNEYEEISKDICNLVCFYNVIEC